MADFVDIIDNVLLESKDSYVIVRTENLVCIGVDDSRKPEYQSCMNLTKSETLTLIKTLQSLVDNSD